MSATTSTEIPAPPHKLRQRWPLARIVSRQMWPLAALVFLLAGRTAVVLAAHYGHWHDALALRGQVGSHAYHFGRYIDDAHAQTARLLGDGADLALRPALYAAALTGAMTGREWGSRRVALTLTQSIPARRWFATRWAALAIVMCTALTPLVVLYRRSASHALHLDLLTYGADRQSAYFTVGPVTVAYVLLGTAAGALAGTVLRRAWPALIAAPAATWLITAVLVRTRAALLLDVPAWSHVKGMHPGGVLGLQFYDVLPQDSYLIDSLRPSDYWPYQAAQSTLVIAVAALLLWQALRTVRHRTQHA
jgi:hypothetical protein